MELDENKIDDVVLALLMLGIHDEQPPYAARAWKSHDWDALDRLHDKGYLCDPKSKAKSVVVTPEGLAKGRDLLQQRFGKAE